jgi:hypothetical protein
VCKPPTPKAAMRTNSTPSMPSVPITQPSGPHEKAKHGTPRRTRREAWAQHRHEHHRSLEVAPIPAQSGQARHSPSRGPHPSRPEGPDAFKIGPKSPAHEPHTWPQMHQVPQTACTERPNRPKYPDRRKGGYSFLEHGPDVLNPRNEYNTSLPNSSTPLVHSSTRVVARTGRALRPQHHNTPA